MSILTWIEDKKRLKILAAPKHVDRSADSSKGLWTRCDKCGVILYIKHLKENQRVCFGCSYHLQMMSQERIENLLDKMPAPSSSRRKKSASGGTSSLRPGGTRSSARETIVSTWRPLDETVSPCDPLHFHDQKDYTERLRDAQERTGLQDAIQTGTGMIDGIPVALAVMDFSFMGGSMGSVVGEKITRLIEYATQEGLTLLIVSASGGARMQEGVFSLMQMAKISSALQIYQKCANLLYISILSSPTTGGVTASFAMLGDIIFAEPKALIAFAGRRVIEQTLCEDLPDDFQTSEYMLHHGLVDLIVPRRFLRQALSESIRLYQNAPFKKRGQIPFGVQNPITFITEERVRRQWGRLVKEVRKGGVGVNDNQVIAPNKSSIGKGGIALQDKFTPSEDGALTGARTAVYREILTSFEIMLALFVSGNSKKQKQSDAFSANKASLVEHNPAKVPSLQLSKKLSVNAPSPLRVKRVVNDKSKSRSFSARVGVPGFLKSVSNRVEEWSATQPPQSFLSGVAKRDKRFLMAFASQNVRTTFLTSRFFNREYSVSRDYRKNQPLYLLLKANFQKVTPQKPSSFSAHTLAPQGLAYVLGSGGKAIARNQNGNIPISEQTWGVTQSKQPPLVHNSNGNNVLRSSCTVGARPFAPCPSSKGMGQTSKEIKTERWRDNQKKPLLPSFSKQDRPRSAKSTRLHELGKVKLPLSKHISTAFFLKKNKGEEPLTNRRFVREAPKKNQPFSDKSSICKWYKSNSFQNGPKNVQSARKKVRPIASLSFNCKNKGKLYKKVSTCKKLTNFLKDVEKSFSVPKSFLTGVSPYTRLKQSFVREACLDFDLFSGIIPSQQESDTLSFGSVLQSKTSQKGRDVYPTLASQDQLQETGVYLERSRFDLLHSFRFFSEGTHILNNGPGSALASPAFKGRELDNAINRSAIGMTHTAYLCQRALSSLLSIGLQSSDNLQSGNKNSIRRVLTLALTNRRFVTPSPSRASCKSSYLLPRACPKEATKVLGQQRCKQAKIRKEQGNGKMQKGVYKKGSVKTHLYKKQLGCGSKPSFINGNGSVLSEGLSSKAMQSQSLDKASKDSLRRENDLNFLNQAIELAATESIEWRAFYIHQQLCENTGFLEDFLQKNSSSTSFGESAKTGNVLFYKSICRSKKTLDD